VIVFAGSFGKGVSRSIVDSGDEVGRVEYSKFANGEKRVILGSDVGDKECVVVQSMTGKPDEALVEALLLIDALKENGSSGVRLVVPLLGYSLMNRHFDNEPVSARVIAKAISSSGVDEVIIVDIHSKKVLEFFDVSVRNVDSTKLFVKCFREMELDDLMVVGPDDGSSDGVERLSSGLGVDGVVCEKIRDEKSTIIEKLDINVEKVTKNVIISDDLVNTGGTISRIAELLRSKGAENVMLCAAHFLGVKGSREKVLNGVDLFVTTNSVDHGLNNGENVRVLKLGPDLLR